MKGLSIRPRHYTSGKIRYEYRVETATINGKRNWITKGGFKTKGEASRAGREALRQYENTGAIITRSEISFADFLATWLSVDCVDLKETTLSNYKKIIKNNINPMLGAYRINALSKELLQGFINDMFDTGRSINSLSVYKAILSKALRYAVDTHYLQYNPADRLKIPQNRTPRVQTEQLERIYIPKEKMLEIFARFPEGSTAHIPLRLGYECGLRIGEAFALTWDNVDFKHKTITISKQIQWHADKSRSSLDKLKHNGSPKCGNGYWYFCAPKYKSFRTIEITDELANLLQREYEKQQAFADILKNEFQRYYAVDAPSLKRIEKDVPISTTFGSGCEVMFVCRNDLGKYTQPRTMQHTSRVIRETIIQGFNYHSLRHTHATMLAENQVNTRYIMTRLGHKKEFVTIEVYTHTTDTMREQGRAMINSIF